MRNRIYACVAGAVAVLLPALGGTDPALNEKWYGAIRSGELAAVEDLIEAGANVNFKDSRGATPLMYAAAVGTPAMMRRLIAAGADVNARSAFDATAIMWCANDLEKVRLLIDGGADLKVRSKRGRTPLLNAAVHQGNTEVVRLMLARGASTEGSPLVQAAIADDTATARMLLARGENPNARNARNGFTPLMYAAANGNAGLVKDLIARGADVNARSDANFGEIVKNGPIAIGHITPLMTAVVSGSDETVRLLLEAGANVNATDIRGMTPLMLAVATDHPSENAVRMLLAKGAATDLKSKDGETALAWAAKFRNPSILPLVAKASPEIKAPRPVEAVFERPGYQDPRQALEKSIGLLQRNSLTFLREGGCASCHSHQVAQMAVKAAASKGVPVDAKLASETARGIRLQFASLADGLLERADPPVVDILTYALLALSYGESEPDRTTDAMVHNIAAQQRSNGSWLSSGIQRPPMSDGGFSETALALRAVRQFAPPARKAEMEQRVAKAAAWLIASEPGTTEDRVMQLLGVTWAGADRQTLDRLSRKLVATQRDDGGWAQTPHLESDAYATGTVLFALHEAGLAPSADAYRKGAQWLLRNQAADGSWHVASRAPKFQPYFESGFPYGHDQWISQMATGWASIALSAAVPEMRAGR